MDNAAPPHDLPPDDDRRSAPDAAAPFQINVESTPKRSSRSPANPTRRRQQARGRWTALAAMLAAAVISAAGLAWLALRPAGMPAPGATPAGPAAQNTAATPAANDAVTAEPANRATQPGVQWQSPTAGPPLDLSDVPPGVQLLVQLRPRAWFEKGERQKTVAGLGPLANWPAALTGPSQRSPAGGEESVDSTGLERLLPCAVQQLERLLVSVWEDRQGTLRFAVVAEAAEPFSAAQFDALRLPAGGPGAPRFQDGWGWWLPPRLQGKRIVVAPAEELKELVAQAGQATELRRDLAELVEHSDGARLATLVVSREFWNLAGPALTTGPSAILQESLQALLHDDWQAALVNVHLDDNFFCELRIATRPESPAAKRAALLTQDLAAQPARVAQRLADAPGGDYGRALLGRLPLMVDSWQRQTRVSVVGRHVLARSYLPAVAAHNLAWSAQLMALGPQDAAAPPTAAAATSPDRREKTIAVRLLETTSLSFPRSTLEGAIETLGGQLGVRMEIVGRDLQLEGITKNQSFGLDARDLPAGEILLQILRQASPDGKLVYVIGTTDDGARAVFITTRAAAQQRGQEFTAPGDASP